MEQRLDFPLDSLHKPRHVKALLELSRASGRYPECLVLGGVEMGEFPVASGSYGDVYRGRWQNTDVAVKVMKVYQRSDLDKLLKVLFNRWWFTDSAKPNLQAFSSEAVLWRQLSHPNILPFYGIYRLDRSIQRLCLMAPWMENGNVVEFLRENPETYCVHLVSLMRAGIPDTYCIDIIT